MKWIRTQSGKLVNLAHMAEVSIQNNRTTVAGSEVMQFVLRAHEPSYTETPCHVDLMRFASRKEADEALTDLFDWLSEEPVGCDFSAAAEPLKAGA